jgi:4-hydroxybenzoyl-CoA thioesterase/acyl-CoA thioester hydrolase
MSVAFTTQRRVEFCETDAAGIAHFSVFFTYMEQAEHALLRHVGLSVMLRDDEGLISWPRVSAACEYQGSARFEDVLDVEVRVERLGSRSVTYAFTFTRQGQAVATGRVTAVCCRMDSDHRLSSIDIPERIASRLREYLPCPPTSNS